MDTLSKTHFKAHALEVFREIENSGEPMIITDRGKPTLEIRKLRQRTESPLEILRGTVLKYEDPLQPVSEDDWENS
jgi:antitoxin (DNA-binding transcriptional repressor) of toxin-antitoxin stability system